jgi:putative sigma-54 modulation protein
LRIQITGRHIGVTEAMKAYAREKVEKLGTVYARLSHVDVVMDVVHGAHVVEMEAFGDRHTRLVAKVESPDMNAAVDLAEGKLLAQLRRHVQKLADHHRGEGQAFLRSADGAPPAPAASGPGDETYEDVIDRMKDGE